MQKDAGAKGTEWTGVRNYLARNNMRAMKIGDKGFFYHSNEGLEIVGITEVCALSHPDSTADGDPKWDCVDIRAVCDLPEARDRSRTSRPTRNSRRWRSSPRCGFRCSR